MISHPDLLFIAWLIREDNHRTRQQLDRVERNQEFLMGMVQIDQDKLTAYGASVAAVVTELQNLKAPGAPLADADTSALDSSLGSLQTSADALQTELGVSTPAAPPVTAPADGGTTDPGTVAAPIDTSTGDNPAPTA